MRPTVAAPIKKSINQAPGFTCPACEKATIQLSLDQFLDTSQVKCPICATVFTMNKTECAQLVNMLHRVRTAHRNVEFVSNRKL